MVKVSNDNTMTNFIIQERVKRFLAEGKFDEAEKYYLKSLKFKEQAYGADDPSILPLLKEIRSYYEHINEDEKAEEFKKRCEKIEDQSVERSDEIKIEKDFYKDKKQKVSEDTTKKSKEIFIYNKIEDDVDSDAQQMESEEIPVVNKDKSSDLSGYPRAYYYGQIARVLDYKGDVSEQISEWAKYPGKMILNLGSLKPPVNTPHDKLLIQIMSTVSPIEPSDLNSGREKDSNDQVAFWMGYYSKDALIS